MSIGLAVWDGALPDARFRTRDELYLRMTRFWGKLFLINFALGVVTGITLEFQFGMNWAEYSKYVGDIFGAPLAIEATLAFFLESTFIGLWIFGWDRLSPRVHLATAWLTAFGTVLSAYFILAANSWMQHPGLGYVINQRHPPRRTDEHLRRAHQLDAAARVSAHHLRLHSAPAGFIVLGHLRLRAAAHTGGDTLPVQAGTAGRVRAISQDGAAALC